MIDVAILNTSEDTIALLCEIVTEEGWSATSDYIVEFRRDRQDISAFFQKHQPKVVIYDLAVPYEENWQFLRECVVPASGLSHGQFVLTTTNKGALEQLVGQTPTIELIAKPFDIDEVVQAVHRAMGVST